MARYSSHSLFLWWRQANKCPLKLSERFDISQFLKRNDGFFFCHDHSKKRRVKYLLVASMASSSVNVSFKSFGAFFLSTEIERNEEYTEDQRGVFLTFGILVLNAFCNC